MCIDDKDVVTTLSWPSTHTRRGPRGFGSVVREFAPQLLPRSAALR